MTSRFGVSAPAKVLHDAHGTRGDEACGFLVRDHLALRELVRQRDHRAQVAPGLLEVQGRQCGETVGEGRSRGIDLVRHGAVHAEDRDGGIHDRVHHRIHVVEQAVPVGIGDRDLLFDVPEVARAFSTGGGIRQHVLAGGEAEARQGLHAGAKAGEGCRGEMFEEHAGVRARDDPDSPGPA